MAVTVRLTELALRESRRLETRRRHAERTAKLIVKDLLPRTLSLNVTYSSTSTLAYEYVFEM